jgi:DNA-binding transcriptional MerR regulator
LDTCERFFMTLAEIAEASGLPARTIRFYIARGLLNGPIKGGPGAAYTAEHVARLERIKRLQAAGNTLLDVARILSGPSAKESEAVPATAWWQHAIADDVVVWVRAGGSPWRTKQIRSAVEEFARRIGQAKNESGKESGPT